MSIDRNLMGRLEFIRDYECKVDAEVNAINEAIEKLTVEPERKTGRWLKAYGEHEAMGIRPFYRYCSRCNEATAFPHKYCPNCGAKMEEEA